MYIRTIKLEKEGLKDFWQEIREEKELERKKWWNNISPIKVYDIPSFDEEEQQYEGGRKKNSHSD
jgi:hypothetical protein